MRSELHCCRPSSSGRFWRPGKEVNPLDDFPAGSPRPIVEKKIVTFPRQRQNPGLFGFVVPCKMS